MPAIGELTRTGIRRIFGAQAPDVNDVRPVAALTLQPFDAIVLLIDLIEQPYHAWNSVVRENCPGGPARTW